MDGATGRRWPSGCRRWVGLDIPIVSRLKLPCVAQPTLDTTMHAASHASTATTTQSMPSTPSTQGAHFRPVETRPGSRGWPSSHAALPDGLCCRRGFGLVIGTALGWGNLPTIVLAVSLALRLWLRIHHRAAYTGAGCRGRMRQARTGRRHGLDCIMELVDNSVMWFVPGHGCPRGLSVLLERDGVLAPRCAVRGLAGQSLVARAWQGARAGSRAAPASSAGRLTKPVCGTSARQDVQPQQMSQAVRITDAMLARRRVSRWCASWHAAMAAAPSGGGAAFAISRGRQPTRAYGQRQPLGGGTPSASHEVGVRKAFV